MADDTVDEREGWAIARVVESNEEAILLSGFLRSNGIPAEVESLHVEELPVNLGGLGEVRVWVPADHLEEAAALLDARDDGAFSETPDMEEEPDPSGSYSVGPPRGPGER
jgi:hypothetical protein